MNKPRRQREKVGEAETGRQIEKKTRWGQGAKRAGEQRSPLVVTHELGVGRVVVSGAVVDRRKSHAAGHFRFRRDRHSRRHAACGEICEQEAVLKAAAVRSPLPIMSSILPCPPCLPQVVQTQILFHQCKSNSSNQQGGGYMGRWWGKGEGRGVWGAGDISSTLPYTAQPHGACPKGTSHNYTAHVIWNAFHIRV